MNRWIIDRFEGHTAVLEHTETLETALRGRNELPDGAREGDALAFEDGRYFIDRAETEKRASEIRARYERLKQRNKK